MSEEYIAPVGREGIYILETGSWRTQTPLIDAQTCIACGRCRMYCPVGAVHRSGERFEIDTTYCKGCGICAAECPVGAIEMREEES